MNLVGRSWRVLREQGPRGVVRRLAARRASGAAARMPAVLSPVLAADVAAVDWTVPHPAVVAPRPVAGDSFDLAWIMSTPGLGSGGHQNIFRFIRALEDAGHRVRVYLYGDDGYGPREVREMLAASPNYPDVAASFERFVDGVAAEVDAIVATSWETAYPSFRDGSPARRFYFVQDFEPWFFPVGSAAVLAENTYRFGFTGFTAGRWLAQKLSAEFGMETHPFDFGADRALYSLTNRGPRREVFFYARPSTERRGFELGMLALARFAQLRPDVTINVVGESVAGVDVPFAHVNLTGLAVPQLNEVYNRCAAGLVLSLTNMSLLPLELLAAGVIPVVNDAPNNRVVSDNPCIEWAPAVPVVLAQRLADILDRDDLPLLSARASESVSAVGWEESTAAFVAAFEGSVRG